MRRVLTPVVLSALFCAAALSAHAPSGAIFTTLPDGSEVNFNHYAAKEDVYLDGGPGPGAPQDAAGLDDGVYFFQVTDPSGKTLLSTDPAKCRQFNVAAGVIQSVVAAGGCEHVIGNDVDHPPARTVQLMPYNNTPNNGGVYKAWVTRYEDFILGCAELGKTEQQALDGVDCGNKTGGNAHGFIPSHSKTDNFKVKETKVREIDTRFFRDSNNDGHKQDGEEWLDGLQVTWNDPIGASNKKSSYWAPHINVFHEAHVEAVEDGTHLITIENQSGCTVGMIHIDNEHAPTDGPQTISVPISKRDREITIFIDVACAPQ